MMFCRVCGRSVKVRVVFGFRVCVFCRNNPKVKDLLPQIRNQCNRPAKIMIIEELVQRDRVQKI